MDDNLEQKEIKLDFNTKKVVLTIAIIFFGVAIVSFLFLWLQNFDFFKKDNPIVEDKGMAEEMTIERRKSILRDRYVKRELTKEEKQKIKILEKRYEEKKNKNLTAEEKQQQKEVDERIKILMERNKK